MSTIEESLVCYNICSFIGPYELQTVQLTSRSFYAEAKQFISECEVVATCGLYKRYDKYWLPYVDTLIPPKMKVKPEEDGTLSVYRKLNMTVKKYSFHENGYCKFTKLLTKDNLVPFNKTYMIVDGNNMHFVMGINLLDYQGEFLDYDTDEENVEYDTIMHYDSIKNKMLERPTNVGNTVTFLDHHTLKYANRGHIALKKKTFKKVILICKRGLTCIKKHFAEIRRETGMKLERRKKDVWWISHSRNVRFTINEILVFFCSLADYPGMDSDNCMRNPADIEIKDDDTIEIMMMC